METFSAPARLSSSDAALLEVLRVEGSAGIGDLARVLGVTATAVRQRLDRLMQAELVCREKAVSRGTTGRGRPAHRYSLTEKGRRSGGDNFRDLSVVLWRELRRVADPAVRQGLIARVGGALAEFYRGAALGETPAQRLEGVASAYRQRSMAWEVAEDAGGLPVLTAHACPYPELAELDRGICAAERLMMQELAGTSVRLAECRLDGDACCRFLVTGSEAPSEPPVGGNP